MKNSETVEKCVLEFFETILAGRIPARDIEASNKIRQALVAEAGVTTDELWRSALQSSVTWLASEPTRWSKAIEFAALYFDADHRRNQKHDGLKPSTLFARELMAANRGGIAIFFVSIDTISTFRAIEPLIPSLELSEKEITDLILTSERFATESIASGLDASSIIAWAERDNGVAKNIVDGWLSAQPSARRLPLSGLQLLVEGVMLKPTISEKERLVWRDHVLRSLSAESDEKLQRLAIYLTCFAWPEGTPVAKRHEALLASVQPSPRPSPADLASVGMSALARDATQHPREVLQSLGELVRMLATLRVESTHQALLLSEAARVVSLLLSSRNAPTPTPVELESVVKEILTLAPDDAVKGSWFDVMLSTLVQKVPSFGKECFFSWLRTHASILLKQRYRLEKILQSVVCAVEQPMMGTWVVAWLIDRNRSLREYASRCLANQESFSPSMEAVAHLTVIEAQALVHMLLGSQLLGAPLVMLLAEIAETRSDVMPVVRTAMTEELLLDYRRCCQNWLEQLRLRELPLPAHVEELRASLEEALTARVKALDSRPNVPELYATSPGRMVWLDVESRLNGHSYRAGLSESPFYAMIRKVPIARGEGTRLGGSGEKQPFAHQEFQFELPAREFVDPVNFRLTRRQHHQRAAELLEGGKLDEE